MKMNASLGLSLSLALMTAALPASVRAQNAETAPVKAETTAAAPAPLSPATADLIEDIRLLTTLKRLMLTPDQAARLAELADTAQVRQRDIREAEARRLDSLRESIAAGRTALLQGQELPNRLDDRIEDAEEAAERQRETQRKALIQTLAGRVREILKADQEAVLYDLVRLPPPAVIQASGAAGASLARGPYSDFPDPRRASEDVKDLLEDLDDLRQASGTPKFEREVADFREKFTRGLDPVSPEYGHAAAQADAFAAQVASLSPEAYARQRVQFAVHGARVEQQGKVRERQARLSSDPFGWFVEKVLLKERAAPVLREKAALR
jgi:hypothetical protein